MLLYSLLASLRFRIKHRHCDGSKKDDTDAYNVRNKARDGSKDVQVAGWVGPEVLPGAGARVGQMPLHMIVVMSMLLQMAEVSVT
jgi:hypothetical protein